MSANTQPTVAPPVRVPLKQGLLAGALDDLTSVGFAGIRCRKCGVALLGERVRCENCSSRDVATTRFANTGTVHSVTVQRYPPPSPFVADLPWVPRALAWIDLDERGPRLMGVVSGPPELVRIGSRVRVEFIVGWSDEQGREVVSFVFHRSE